jgi:integrase
LDFSSENPEAPLRHEDVLSRKIQPKTRELGLPHVTWRLLRKWGSTHLIANRLPVNAVQERLGHSPSQHRFGSLCATAG